MKIFINMNLRKIIREEMDDLDWIKNIPKAQPITELKPGDKYIIIEISGNAKRDFLKDPDLKNLNPKEIVFHIDVDDNFVNEDSEYKNTWEEGYNTVWVNPIDDKIAGAWLRIDTIIVVKV